MDAREQEDARYQAECKRLLDERAKLVTDRYLTDAKEAGELYWEALSLRADAEGKHAAALAASDTLRGAIYRATGWRGPRPAELKLLDDTERRARDQMARMQKIADEAKRVMSAFASVSKNSTPENGNS